jgi:hypothetical protein
LSKPKLTRSCRAKEEEKKKEIEKIPLSPRITHACRQPSVTDNLATRRSFLGSFTLRPYFP